MNEEQLQEALEYALRIILLYELDIRTWNDGRLLREGFCQGVIYKSARKAIRKIAGLTEE